MRSLDNRDRTLPESKCGTGIVRPPNTNRRLHLPVGKSPLARRSRACNTQHHRTRCGRPGSSRKCRPSQSAQRKPRHLNRRRLETYTTKHRNRNTARRAPRSSASNDRYRRNRYRQRNRHRPVDKGHRLFRVRRSALAFPHRRWPRRSRRRGKGRKRRVPSRGRPIRHRRRKPVHLPGRYSDSPPICPQPPRTKRNPDTAHRAPPCQAARS